MKFLESCDNVGAFSLCNRDTVTSESDSTSESD